MHGSAVMGVGVPFWIGVAADFSLCAVRAQGLSPGLTPRPCCSLPFAGVDPPALAQPPMMAWSSSGLNTKEVALPRSPVWSSSHGGLAGRRDCRGHTLMGSSPYPVCLMRMVWKPPNCTDLRFFACPWAGHDDEAQQYPLGNRGLDSPQRMLSVVLQYDGYYIYEYAVRVQVENQVHVYKLATAV